MSQLQKLLQTYFGAMRHCLVCHSTVGATNFTARGSFRTLDPLGIHSRVNGDCAKRTLNSSEERKTEEAYSLSSIKASTIVLELASNNLNFPRAHPWNLIWEWRLTLPSFRLANRQTTVYFRSTQSRLWVGYGTSCLNYRSYCRLILAPCAIAWSAIRRSVPRISLPEDRFALWIPWESIPESTETAQNGH